MSHRIVFLDRATIAPQIRVRPPSFAHELIEHAETRADQVAERLAGASIAITNKAPITAAALERLPALKLVAVAATGTDCVDKAACAARGVAVSNIRGYAINTVPEHTFALILALRRNIVAYRESVLAGRWQESGSSASSTIRSATCAARALGILGEGVLGQRVAELGKAFGMQPMFAAHKGKSGLGPAVHAVAGGDRDERRHHAAFAADEETRGMIAMPEFEAMKRKPLIVNTARGGLVDEAALVRALDAGLIAGAGFDVVDGEPPKADNPLMRAAARHNVILTPHVAWASDEAQQALADQLVDNIENFVAGRPTNLVEGAY
jgi:glycerate dehydrogenase